MYINFRASCCFCSPLGPDTLLSKLFSDICNVILTGASRCVVLCCVVLCCVVLATYVNYLFNLHWLFIYTAHGKYQIKLCSLVKLMNLKVLPPSCGTPSFVHVEEQAKLHFLALLSLFRQETVRQIF
jgi:hypothetical protein